MIAGRIPSTLLHGAIDLHVHGYPDLGFDDLGRVDDVTMVQMAREARLRGIALKSHLWPTMDRAYLLNQQFATDDFTVFSSIVLNPIAGSLSPMSVEAAAAHGAKLVYLPTWGSCHDHEHTGGIKTRVIEPHFPSIPRELDKHGAISMLDSNGKVVPEIHDIIAICKERGLTLCTGHVSRPESLAVLQAAHAAGLDRLIATHPFASSLRTPIDEAREYARLGAVSEICFAGTVSANQRMQIHEVAEIVRALGPENCILTTDVYFEYLPPQPEALRMFVHQLAFIGMPEADIRMMIAGNPARLLGL